MMMKKIKVFLLIGCMCLTISCIKREIKIKEDDKMDWFRSARFGLFIHWGLYSIPAGEWQGKSFIGDAACIRENAQIPIQEYDSLVSAFHPSGFNANEWVTMAKNAGMKYIVVTSKHHDGFCMFDSKVTDFDIMSTPFKRDILAELSDACVAHGIQFCVYYSIMDWHHPDYLPRRPWDNKTATGGANYDRYILYVKNQIKELLTKYGKVGIGWFDGEWENSWNIERAKDVYCYTRELQPEIILKTGHGINGKGHLGTIKMDTDSCYFSDYGTPNRKTIPSTGLPDTEWENILVMNRNWGYHKNDQEWKTSKELVRILIENASKGGNFLLNIGPTSDGLFPDSAIVRLKEIGKWMDENSESIYHTSASPFSELSWGRCTQKSVGKNTVLYFHIFDWPGNDQLIVPGLKNKISKAYALSDKEQKRLPVKVSGNKLIINIQGIRKSDFATVIALKVKGHPVVLDPSAQ
jgi:alpha-L-fucosidase